MSAFSDATAVRTAGDGRFDVDLHPDWSVGGRPNGGYLLSIMGRAAIETTGKPHPLAVSAHFLAPPAGGPGEVSTELMREGRRVSAVRATLRQEGTALVDALITVGELPERSEPLHQNGAMPQVTPVEDCLEAKGVAPGATKVGLHEFVDLRIDPASVGWADGNPGGSMEIRGWCRLRDGTDPDPLILLQMGDAFPPVTFISACSGGCRRWSSRRTSGHNRPRDGWLAGCRRGCWLTAGSTKTPSCGTARGTWSLRPGSSPAIAYARRVGRSKTDRSVGSLERSCRQAAKSLPCGTGGKASPRTGWAGGVRWGV